MRRRAEELNRLQMEARRLSAMEMFQAGLTQAAVARALGVSRTATSRWAKLVSVPGGLLTRKAPGRPPVVPTVQIAEIVSGRKKWSTPTLAAAVFDATGVRYHPDHIFRRAKGART